MGRGRNAAAGRTLAADQARGFVGRGAVGDRGFGCAAVFGGEGEGFGHGVDAVVEPDGYGAFNRAGGFGGADGVAGLGWGGDVGAGRDVDVKGERGHGGDDERE